MRSLLALQIPEHVTSTAYHMAHHHVPIDTGSGAGGGGGGGVAGLDYSEGDTDLDKSKRDKIRGHSMWSRPKLVGTNEKLKSSLKKPIPKGGGHGTDFSIAV